MLSIENQISTVQGMLQDIHRHGSDATLIESILNSLERLRDTEAKEPVAWYWTHETKPDHDIAFFGNPNQDDIKRTGRIVGYLYASAAQVKQ